MKSLPHLVILVRVLLAFAVLGFFALPHPFPVWGLVLTVVAIAMDGLDGWLARKLGVVSELGAVLDITGDRIVEHAFWIYFAVVGLVPLWIPLVIVSRSFLVDAVRSLALSRGRTPFGERTLQRSAVSRFLVASRTMRALYGVAKGASFVLLGSVIAARGASVDAAALEFVAVAVAVATVGICVVRAVPVLWDARALLSAPATAPRRRRRPLPAGRG